MATDLVTVRYIGRAPAVELNPDGLGVVEVARGETLNVPAEVGSNMLLQYANWELVTKPATAPVVTNTQKAEVTK